MRIRFPAPGSSRLVAHVHVQDCVQLTAELASSQDRLHFADLKVDARLVGMVCRPSCCRVWLIFLLRLACMRRLMAGSLPRTPSYPSFSALLFIRRINCWTLCTGGGQVTMVVPDNVCSLVKKICRSVSISAHPWLAFELVLHCTVLWS